MSSPTEVNNLADSIYTAYCEAVGGKAFNGDVLPPWGEFSQDPAKEKQKLGWLAGAEAAIEFFAGRK